MASSLSTTQTKFTSACLPNTCRIWSTSSSSRRPRLLPPSRFGTCDCGGVEDVRGARGVNGPMLRMRRRRGKGRD